MNLFLRHCSNEFLRDSAMRRAIINRSHRDSRGRSAAWVHLKQKLAIDYPSKYRYLHCTENRRQGTERERKGTGQHVKTAARYREKELKKYLHSTKIAGKVQREKEEVYSGTARAVPK